MCLLVLLLFGGPRLISIVWYLADQARWNATFDGILIPILGFLFLPWTMVMYVLVFPNIEGFEWALAVGLERRAPTIIDAVIDRSAIAPVTRYDRVRIREL